jgi:hypothetical protein
MSPDGTFGDYASSSATAPFRKGTAQISKKWTDPDGNVWYQTYDKFTLCPIPGLKTQTLWKINESGTTAEFQWIVAHDFNPAANPDGYPTQLDPSSHNYLIYSRSKE